MIKYKNIKSIKNTNNTKNINHINNMNNIVTVVVLGVVFVSLTMASWLLPPQEFSDSERRKLAFKWNKNGCGIAPAAVVPGNRTLAP